MSEVEVRPKPGNRALGRAKGAIVNVVALATTVDEYVKLVEATMSEHGFFVVNHARIVLLDDTIRPQLHPELARLARGLTEEFPVQFDRFFSYPHDDA